MKKSKQKAKSLKAKNIVHVLTGSIASYKAGDLSKALREEGASVTCVMTKGASEFVTPLTMRALSGSQVYQDAFTLDTPFDVLHTSLAEQADLVLVAPASANFIARLANGMADDLASCLILATKSPVLLIPAMNDQMYQHPLTQKNIKTLKQIGYNVMSPIKGQLVCGKYALGHIPEPEAILKRVKIVLG